ncbi:hypothetical protein Asppvi_010375 [Aspergillus pseudoviridinutans]|uniref:NmrA-like domain-containing protein n=1 Tax=Aspergillus pseudoviridinutans TaxID=1517512 RepID=A0A9P3BLA2_9EURO|nr:uncharacterized protein Asppvi_010375 [Aspergillus pseudoviridinutans]GIJ91410.1 hypothetical protein Asppvi_010375 [Aspergillus pseudoviridinutans]
MDFDRKVFVVFGATGIQGGSVAKAILDDSIAAKQFRVRAISRDPAKPAATALAEQGAEVIKADMEAKESLRMAMKDAHGVFAVTDFWQKMEYLAETRQGKNVADIAKEMGVKHLIWSSLPNISQITDGKLTAAVHFDGKARVDEYIRSLAIPHTIVRLGVYNSFLLESLVPVSSDPPSYKLVFPEPVHLKAAMPLLDPSADLGGLVKAILLRPDRSLNRQFNIAERYYTLEEIINSMKSLGLNVDFQAIDQKTFKDSIAARGWPDFLQEDVVQVFQYATEYGYFQGEGIEQAHELVSQPLTSLEKSLSGSADFAKLIK